jgi:hypothetical protein
VTSGKDIRVGISISEPDEAELVSLGLSELHIRRAFTEIVRHILAQGWGAAYGGDFRDASYTDTLIELVDTYSLAERPGPDRVFSYLAWPIWRGLTNAKKAELANVLTIREIPSPDGAPQTLPAKDDRQPADLLWNSLALTKMRQRMNSEIGARVVLGGRVSNQQGLYPGVAEEAVLALRSGVPLYVLGGFGGCGRLVAAALGGSRPSELSLEYQLRHTDRYPELLEAAGSAGQEPSFPGMIDTFVTAGADGLNNGLSAQDNSLLFTADNLDEIIALMLRGLRNVT